MCDHKPLGLLTFFSHLFSQREAHGCWGKHTCVCTFTSLPLLAARSLPLLRHGWQWGLFVEGGMCWK